MRPSIWPACLALTTFSHLPTTTAAADSVSASTPGSGSGPNLSILLAPHPPILVSASALPPSTHATLLDVHGRSTRAYLTKSHSLRFQDLAPGSYLLDVYSRDLVYPPLRVDVFTGVDAEGDEIDVQGATMQATLSPAAQPGGQAQSQSQGQRQAQDSPQDKAKTRITVHQTFRGNDWSNKGALIATKSIPVRNLPPDTPDTPTSNTNTNAQDANTLEMVMRPMAMKQFYQERAGFSLLSFFKSPMILMGLVTCGLVFGLPYLMNNLDPEMKAEMEEMQRELLPGGSSGTAAQLQNFDLASWMAGKAPVAAGTTAGSGTGAGIGSGTGTGTGSGAGRKR